MSTDTDTAALTVAFGEPDEADRAVLGGKGAGLVEMTALGLPVPSGFVLGTPCWRAFREAGALPDGLEDELRARIGVLEEEAGRRFGDDAAPLLVSVRSGAPVSMPGMMDTILNCGLTFAGAEALATETGDERFAYSSLERLLHGFATTVRGVSAAEVEDKVMDLPKAESDLAGIKARCELIASLLEEESGSPFPDAAGQLHESIEAVFRSWDGRRAKAYRRHKGIDDDMGTAVVVQRMVFGNRGEESGSGVAFTRDPSTGATGAYGDFLFDAQGEDVVAGERDTLPLADLGAKLPEVMAELEGVFATLEGEARDLCDIEFTVEEGRLWVLQTRVGQRSGRAAVRLAVAFCDEGTITQEEAVARVDDEQLEAARAPVFPDEAPDDEVVARGLAASPGVAVGAATFDPERAQTRKDEGGTVVLIRPTTSPADLPGVIASSGVVTGRGGRTSHAAVVARGMGRAAVCGVGAVVVAKDGKSATVDGVELADGDTVSVDGDRGFVSRGERPTAPAEEDPILARFLEWRGGGVG